MFKKKIPVRNCPLHAELKLRENTAELEKVISLTFHNRSLLKFKFKTNNYYCKESTEYQISGFAIAQALYAGGLTIITGDHDDNNNNNNNNNNCNNSNSNNDNNLIFTR